MDMSMSISMSMIHREIRARTTEKPEPEPHRNHSQNRRETHESQICRETRHRETTVTRSTEKPEPEPQRNQSEIHRETRARTTQKMAFLPPNFVETSVCISQSEVCIDCLKESDWLWPARAARVCIDQSKTWKRVSICISQSEVRIDRFKESDWLWPAPGQPGFVSTNQKHLYQPIRSIE